MSSSNSGVAIVPVRRAPAMPVIRELADGFIVKAALCRPLKVSARDTYLELWAASGAPTPFGFYESRRLTELIAGRVARATGVDTTRLLAGPVKAQCDRLRHRADPTVAAVHSAIARITTTPPVIAMCPELYRHRYLVQDIVKFRAAAIVAANLDRLQPPYLETLVAGSAESRALRALARTQGAEVVIHVLPRAASSESEVSEHALGHLRTWRNLLSPDGHSYRSLNRTLANLPTTVPGRLVCLLARTRLRRPITDGLELLFVTLYLATRCHASDVTKERLFLAARAPQIRAALTRVALHTGNDLHARRQGDLRFLIRFLLDFPEPHAGTLSGLTRKAIRWHRDRLAQERASMLQRYGATKRLARPRIPVPADGAVRFLKTVEDVVREGEQMGHCVATYVPHALQGRCYVFHVERDGDAATVMVARDGEVVDAQGPRNRRNDAVAWGERLMRAWGRRLRSADHRRREQSAR